MTTNKHTDATLARPEERIIDAPGLKIDIPHLIRQIRNEDAWKKNDRNSITVFKTAGTSIVLGALHKSAELPPHLSDGVMTLQVIEGILQISTDDLSEELHRGQMLAINIGSTYTAKAVEETIYLLTVTSTHH